MQAGDNELAARAAQGDGQAFAQLLERHYDFIYRLAYRYFGVTEDAEDAAQDVCAALAGKLPQFRGQSRFTTWLYRVALNTCRDQRRRHATATRHEAEYLDVAALRREAAADTADSVTWLYETLETVGEDLRETAILVLGEEMTHAQAAQVLSVSESTVSWRMHSLKSKLRQIAKEDQ